MVGLEDSLHVTHLLAQQPVLVEHLFSVGPAGGGRSVGWELSLPHGLHSTPLERPPVILARSRLCTVVFRERKACGLEAFPDF